MPENPHSSENFGPRWTPLAGSNCQNSERGRPPSQRTKKGTGGSTLRQFFGRMTVWNPTANHGWLADLCPNTQPTAQSLLIPNEKTCHGTRPDPALIAKPIKKKESNQNKPKPTNKQQQQNELNGHLRAPSMGPNQNIKSAMNQNPKIQQSEIRSAANTKNGRSCNLMSL